MEIWLTDGQKQQSPNASIHDYAFEVPKDGLFEFHTWLVADAAPQLTALSIDGLRLTGPAGTADRPGYYRCGSVQLTRGRHLLSLCAAQAPQRLLLSEDATVVTTGKAQLLWDNRTGGQPFENHGAVLTEENRRLLVRHGFLFENEHDAERCAVPSGVPLGGLGAGKVELTPQGFFTALTTNNNQDCPVYRLPGCYFAVQVGDGARSVSRLLQTVAVDQPFAPVPTIDAELAFPEAHLAYRDAALPVAVRLHAFSAHVPHDAPHSSLPCVFFRFTLSNPSDRPQAVRLLFSWESLINVGGHMTVPNRDPDRVLPLVYHTWNHAFAWSNRTANVQAPAVVTAGGTGLSFLARTDHGNPNAFGEHLTWTPGPAQVVPDRDLVADEPAFARWFESGADADTFRPAGTGEFRAGALVVAAPLAAGGTATVDFVLAWHLPHAVNTRGQDDSVRYAADWASAAAVVAHAWPRRDVLLAGTGAVRRALESSTLPAWFTRKLLDDRFVAHTNTIYTRDGSFSVNEAPTGMCGCLGTLDQRTCSGAYWTTFFPELDAWELGAFAERQCDDGAMPHDLGHGSFRPGQAGMNWPDLADGYVMQVHRHVQRTGDRAVLLRHYPHVKRALAWACGMDELDSGIPTLKAGRGTTYDNQHWDGISAFIATMHEAALALGADLAERVGDSHQATAWRALADKAHASRLRHLWVTEGAGGYFRNAADPARGATDDSCFIASLAGEWAQAAAGLAPRLAPVAWSAALESIRRRNCSELGMTDQSARADNCPVFLQYPMAYYAAAALWGGRPDLAWAFVEHQDRMVTRLPSTRYNQVLTYGFNGQPLGLPYYMTAPASWLVLDALAGVVPDVARQALQLAPQWLPAAGAWRVPVFTATSWFMLECREAAGTVAIALRPLKQVRPFVVTRLSLALPLAVEPASAAVNGQSTRASGDGKTIDMAVSFDPGTDALALTFARMKMSQQTNSGV